MPAKSVTHTSPDMCPKPEESAQPKESLTHPTEISSAGTFCQKQNDGIEYSSELTSLTKLGKKEAFELPKSDVKCQKCEKCLMDCSISTITDHLDDLEVNEILEERTDKFSKEICYNAMRKSEIVQPNVFISTSNLEKISAYAATGTSKRNCTFTNPHPIKIRQGVRLRSTKHKAENGLELDLHLRKSNLAYDKVNSSCNRSALRKRKSEFIIDKMKSQKSILPPNLNYSTNRLTLVNLSRSDNRIFSISQTSDYATLKLRKSKGNEHISSTQTTSPKSMIPIVELVKMQTHAKKKKTGYNKYLYEETTSNQFICKDFQGDKPEIPTGFHSSKQNSPNFEDSWTVRWKRLSDFLDESLLNAIRPINHALCTDKKSNLDPADCQPKRGRISRSTVLNDDDVEPNIRNKETFDMSKEINSSVLLKSVVKPSHGNNNGELMPDFELMDSQTRNEELDKYGLKPFKKRRGMYNNKYAESESNLIIK